MDLLFLFRNFAVIFCFSTFSVVVDGKDSEFCTRVFDISNRTIIKTTESINQGAKYIKSIKAKSRDECMMACCVLDSCNMAVLQEKVDGDCYLFDCGTLDDFKCTFSVHDDHVAMGMMVNRNDLQKTKVHEQVKHEMDLNLLKTQQDIQAQNQDQNQPIAEPEPEPFPTPPATPAAENENVKALQKNRQQSSADVRPRRPPLRQEDMPAGEDMGFKSDESPAISKSKSVLSKNIAKPQRPFNSQTFRKPANTGCSKVQWQCETSFECIAVYDKCDGIAQCSDKSDEKNCAELIKQPQTPLRNDVPVQQNVPPMYGQYYPADNPPQNEFSRVVQSDNSLQSQNRQQQNGNDFQNFDSDQQNVQFNQQLRPKANVNWPANKNQQIQQPAKVKNTFPSQQIYQKSPDSSPVGVNFPKGSDTNVAVSIEHLDYGRGSTSLAAVMLGLGLAILALLLLFISCRLRRARRRLRRGKVLDTDEGEYLINGLYL